VLDVLMATRTGAERLRSARQQPGSRRARALFRLQRLRLAAERAIDRLARPRRPRVVATACWSFPIYSQTFVYQELTQLARGGFGLRFVYSDLNEQDPLPPQFQAVWRARRFLDLHPAVCEASYLHFLRRSPERVAAIVRDLARASGLAPDEVERHHHFRQAFAFARLVEAARPDYLHSYFFYEGTLFTLVASALLDIPRGVSCYADHMLDDYALKVVPLHLRQCRLIIATSQRIKQELLGIDPATPPDAIVVKPNGINAAYFPAVSRPEPLRDSRFRLVTVSRIEPKKGLVYLVEAMALLRDRGVAADLHLVGGVDNTEASRACAREVANRIEALGLGDVVHLEGRKSEADINALFGRSHVFVAPFIETDTGDKDGVPTSLLEGMAAGLPVVATDAGSIAEVVDDGEDGLLVPQRNPAALADALAALIADPKRRRALGRRAAAKIRDRFDANVGERVFHERLRRLLAGHR
jgi:glycosyltransferase involved in cell wall biosynthesis